MRLLSLTVRNYRLHGDTMIDFDPSRTLIGGPNETGKSTLAEAIHRALFFRHRSGGEPQRAMKSDLHNGHPEVKLVFEASGTTWTLEKRFSGTSGTARLSSIDGTSLDGDEAEEKLGQLTGHPNGTATTLKQLAPQWAHLWVWQGASGDNPTGHAASLRDELVQRLQDQGLAAVMQSETDERAREKIRLTHEQIFTRTGGVKAGSRLDLATKALAEAEAHLARTTEQKQRLEAAAIEQEAATKLLADSEAALPEQREQLAATTASLTKANELRARQENETLVLKAATQAREQVAKADQQIRELHTQAAEAEKALGPAEAKLAVLADQEHAARKKSTNATNAHRAISDAVRLDRQQHDLAAACVDRHEKEAAHQQLAAKAADVAKVEQSLATDREALAKLPAITAKDLDELRQLDSRIAQAKSALEAVATGIELVTTDQPVALDARPLEPGKPRIVTETADLTIGDTHLRIQPGGGTSLADSRRKLDDLNQQLADTLGRLSVKDLGEATEVAAKRQTIDARITQTESRLKDLGARELPDLLATAKDALDTAAAAVDRRHAAMPDGQAPKLPTTLDSARTRLAEAREALQKQESREQTLLVEADAARQAHEEKQATHRAEHGALEAGRKTLADLRASARALEQNHGDAATRDAALETATKNESTAKAALASTTAAISKLDPESLQNTVNRLNRVIATEEEKQRDANTRIAVARSTLSLDGSADPEAELLQARARHATEAEEHAREKRHADAIALLHELFSESQAAISESVTRPIADRVAGYLECLFGRGVRVDVDLTDPAKATLQLTRPGTPPFGFDTLSGGAKEQVAAAVRLATAEILAASHNGCLPVLFDDSFAYADDLRIQSLQAMLDLAATRGLQVIVLTCTPTHYVGLGAKETRFSPPLWNAPSLPASSPAAIDQPDSTPSQSVPVASPTSTAPQADIDLLVETLTRLGGKSGNQKLRKTLGWDEERYTAVKDLLVGRGVLNPGKGQGGSVNIS